MPSTLPHVKLTCQGSLGSGSGNEIWSCGIKVGLAASGSPNTLVAPSQQDVDDLALIGLDAWEGLITLGDPGDAGALFSEWAGVLAVRTAAVGADGHDDPALHSTYAFPTDIVNGHAPVGLDSLGGNTPYQCAVVATFRGPTFRRGAAANGRIYLPVPNLWNNPDANSPLPMVDGAMAQASTAAFAVAVAGFVTRINTQVPLGSGKIKNVCNISTSAAIDGIRFQHVSQVVVDNRPDTVRSRSNKIDGLGKQVVAV
jgi:hypothetical protein